MAPNLSSKSNKRVLEKKSKKKLNKTTFSNLENILKKIVKMLEITFLKRGKKYSL